jgi:hypothetical protein
VSDRPLCTYAVEVSGFSPVYFQAASPSKARAMAYRAFCDAYARWSFHKFLIHSRVWRASG